MSQFQPVWSYPGPISSADCTSTLINQFPVPPSSPMQLHQQICMPAPSAPAAYAAPAVISLGEEYTDETLPQAQTSYLSLEEDESQEEEGFDYYDDNNDDSSDEGDYSPISTSCSPSQTAMHAGQLGAIPALWHAEHARLKHIQAAVLDNEREARTRELKLESEVARIKDDLARLKEARAQSSSSSTTGASNLSVSSVSMSLPSCSSKPITSPNPAQAPPQQRACGPRGPRPRPQQHSSQSHRTSSVSGSTVELSSAATITSVQAPSNSVEWSNNNSNSSSPPSIPASLLGKFSFEEDDDTTETVLSNHLTEARSARAQERQRRKKENERIRELSMLLTLGSEVRKWEERLAWQQARAMASTPSSDDMNLESSTKSSNKDMDTDPDPRVKRLSRSSSLPSRGPYNPTAAPSLAASTSSSTANNGTTANNRSGPPSPALPSLSMSPLWRVSAEMILRRRSLSERPRRMPPKPLLPKATTPVPAPVPEQKVQAQQPPQSQLKKSPSTSSSSPPPPASVSTNATSPTKSGSGSLARPGHVLRGPREQRSSGNSVFSNLASAPTPAASTGVAAAATSSIVTAPVVASSSSISTLSQNATGVSSGSSSPSSGKRYSIPPPITIPSNSQFCTSTTATATGPKSTTAITTGAALRMAGQSPSANMANGTTTFLLSKTTPVRPSALKWAFTADDLARERELEARTQEADLKADQLSDSASSSSEGESDDSRQSSSCDDSSSSSSGPEAASQCVERRGRARFSWRKSLPKDSNNNAQPVANT